MTESTDRQSTGVYRIVVCGIYHIFLRQSAIARSVQRSYHIHGVKPDRGGQSKCEGQIKCEGVGDSENTQFARLQMGC